MASVVDDMVSVVSVIASVVAGDSAVVAAVPPPQAARVRANTVKETKLVRTN
jgi:hypothetical protein